jgi:hypothetical protein
VHSEPSDQKKSNFAKRRSPLRSKAGRFFALCETRSLATKRSPSHWYRSCSPAPMQIRGPRDRARSFPRLSHLHLRITVTVRSTPGESFVHCHLNPQGCDRRAKADSDVTGGSAEAAGKDEVIRILGLPQVPRAIESSRASQLGHRGLLRQLCTQKRRK